MKIKFSVNAKNLDKQLKQSLSKRNNSDDLKKKLESETKEKIFKKFEKLKKEMIKDFTNHPVTKEILSGASASNISGTLGGYGNLFTFIGFESGQNPITPIIELLQKTQITFFKISPRGTSKIRVEMPDKEEIFNVTPLPWAAGISWAQRIEVGLSGLGQYMNKNSPYSRSGKGIQSKNKVRGSRFSNTPYVSSFLNKWNKKFLNLHK